ncbi:MAG: ABC transporter permease [Chitinophagaceae bacterium]|nr:ABC transporter permease [Chitinophagaceae bacterium]MCW5928886.1 ABC transporter permease [Chitinophagaceae bacterium]
MLIKIITQNLLHRWGATLLSIILLCSGVAIISLVMTTQKQVAQKMDNDLKDIDLVVGAKGSPLQLVLSAVYHIDAPTGNIKMSDAEKIMKNPMIEQAIPLAYGDSYEGYRIVGTDSNYLAKYNAVIQKGRLFTEPMEVVLGSEVATKKKLKIGNFFIGSHGLGSEEAHLHKGYNYKVTGILEPTHTVLDHLIITPVASVWLVHQSHEEHDHHDENNHHDHDNTHTETEQEITALLLKFRAPAAQITMPGFINQQTNMQAASPVLEINRLMGLMGAGFTALQAIAGMLMLIAGLSVFISLYSRLAERKYEMALARSMGCSRIKLFTIVLLEGLFICVAGFVVGITLSAAGSIWLDSNAVFANRLDVGVSALLSGDILLLFFVTSGIGLAAAMIPSLKAYHINISKTLAGA